MKEIMRELYYMVDAWADQQYKDDEEAKSLMARKYALEDEMISCIGEDGREMIEDLAELYLKLGDIHNMALFQAALRFGTEIREVTLS